MQIGNGRWRERRCLLCYVITYCLAKEPQETWLNTQDKQKTQAGVFLSCYEILQVSVIIKLYIWKDSIRPSY